MRQFSSRPVLALAAFAGALCAGGLAAQADEANVKAAFLISLNGVGIGRGSFEANVMPQGYTVGVAAKVAGIARLVAGGEGGATARGSYTTGVLMPQSYKIDNTVSDIKNSIALNMAGHNVIAETVVPAAPPSDDRVPVTAASRRGVIDPLSALLVPTQGEALDPENCERVLPIYDGRQRYNIAMAYARTESMRGLGDFEGKTLVCKAAWRPIAGHRPQRDDVKYMEENRDVEVWLMPVPGTHFMIMSKIVVGTTVGRLTVAAQKLSITPGRQASLTP